MSMTCWTDSWTQIAPKSNGEGTTNLTDVDARIRGGLMTTCEFAGHECDPDKRRRCKHYIKATFEPTRCMHYRADMNGACDKSGK